jgi:cell division protein FtsW
MTRGVDKSVVILVFLLLLTGLTAVYSSTAVMPPSIQKGDANLDMASQFVFLKKQGFTMILGIIAMIIAYKLPLKYIKKLTFVLLVLAVVSLLLVFTPLGINAGGARRWLRLWPSSFQPAELVKLAMVIFMAWYLSRAEYDREKFLHFLIPVAVMVVFQGIFMLQPDFGAAMSLAILTLTMLFISGARLRYLSYLALCGLPVVAYLIMAPYRLKRIITFLDPWKDPQGAGFQLTQSFIAFGSGGLQGVGLGESKQKLAFLPEVHTDFIFSLIGEELGFIGAAIVVALFLLLFFRGFMIARRTEDPFAYYLATGVSLMIAVQAVVNFAVVTGLAPTKGLPLPFISYGGSSLLISLVGVGLLMNVSTHRAEKPLRGMMHIGGAAGIAGEDEGQGNRPSQYALGRGYGQQRNRPVPGRRGFRRS